VGRPVRGRSGLGWQQWMVDQIENADFVLLVCTDAYRRRFERREVTGKGKGVTWEGAIISAELYDTQGRQVKFLPIVFSEADASCVPRILSGSPCFLIDDRNSCKSLLKALARQPGVQAPPLGNWASEFNGQPLTSEDSVETGVIPEPNEKKLAPLQQDSKPLVFTEGGTFGIGDSVRSGIDIDRIVFVDSAGPIVILYGPPGVGKTAALMRLCSSLQSGYSIAADSAFRRDRYYSNSIELFNRQRREGFAPDATSRVDSLLVNITRAGSIVCQVLDLPGEHCVGGGMRKGSLCILIT
jgi:hypothetical protein